MAIAVSPSISYFPSSIHGPFRATSSIPTDSRNRQTVNIAFRQSSTRSKCPESILRFDWLDGSSPLAEKGER